MDYEKAFKEAYERASLRFGTNVANELFLEYKESKEERTRRKLIEFFSDWSKTKSYCWGIRVTDIMDWLEKQGKQTHIDDLTQQEAMDIAVAKCFEQGEQKLTNWSEDDEERFQSCLNILQVQAKGFMGITETINTKWLKSLKQRYTWKPRDEQMKALDSAIDEFDGYREFDSLVSLKKDLEKLKRE